MSRELAYSKLGLIQKWPAIGLCISVLDVSAASLMYLHLSVVDHREDNL